MASCEKHGNVLCRFFCSTCSVPVCHVCMERGDHVIPQHQCIPFSQYCEKKLGEIRTLLYQATQHKGKFDQIKSKWDTHLSNLGGEFGKLKSEIRFTKQRLLQEMDFAEQSLLETAGIAKTRKETAIKRTTNFHGQEFSAIYDKLNEKCQILLRKMENQNFAEKEDFQECYDLVDNLQEKLSNFDKEELLGISFTFVPSKTCFLGEVIVPKHSDYTLSQETESANGKGSGNHSLKCMKTDSEAVSRPVIHQEASRVTPAIKEEEGNSQIKSEYVNRSRKTSESGNRDETGEPEQKRLRTDTGVSFRPVIKQEALKGVPVTVKQEEGNRKMASKHVNPLSQNSEASNRDQTRNNGQKHMRTDTSVSRPLLKQEVLSGVPYIKQDKGYSQKASQYKNRTGHDASTAAMSMVNPKLSSNNAKPVNQGSTSTLDVTHHTSVNTNIPSPGSSHQVKDSFPVPEKSGNHTSVSPVSNSQGNIVVDVRCAGIVWVDNDWFVEVSTTKASIKIKHHQLSNRSQIRPDNIISCFQIMEDVELHVCPKMYSPDRSFVVAFKTRIGIISLDCCRGREVTWKNLPTDSSILAISWTKHPSQYLVIVKGSDDKLCLMRPNSEGLPAPDFEVRPLSNVDFYQYHPMDISFNNKFAVCNIVSGSILFFSNLEELNPTRQVVAPSNLLDGQPLALLVIDGGRKWLVLWKGKSRSDGQLKWAIVQYDESFSLLSTVMQFPYKKLHQEPRGFSVHGNKVAVLHNDLQIVLHNCLSLS